MRLVRRFWRGFIDTFFTPRWVEQLAAYRDESWRGVAHSEQARERFGRFGREYLRWLDGEKDWQLPQDQGGS